MPPVPVTQLAAYLNFDMVGRMQNNKLVVQAAGTSPVWARVLERANVAAGFDLVVQPDPYQPTDVASFNQAEVVSLSFTTGSHADYHKPSDTAEKINYEDLDRIGDLAAAIVRSVADSDEAPQFTKVDQPTTSRGSMAGVRVTTGTIPDYATEVKGLLLGGVIGGGPAEQAGLMKGDIIVEIAGQTIANIYDYTYSLELLKVSQPVKIVYMRETEKRETTAHAGGPTIVPRPARRLPGHVPGQRLDGRRLSSAASRSSACPAARPVDGPLHLRVDKRDHEDHRDEAEREPFGNLEGHPPDVVQVLHQQLDADPRDDDERAVHERRDNG